MADLCPRCGTRGLDDARFCFMCSDGVADAARAAEIVAAAAGGSWDAARILGDITDPRAFDVVVRAVSADDAGVRRTALIALGGIGDERGIAAATAALHDEDERVRHAAIAALAEMGPLAADAIAGRLGDPPDRSHAAQALAWLHDDRGFEPLAQILDDPETWPWYDNLYRNPFAAIGWYDDARAVAVLATAAAALGQGPVAPAVVDWRTYHFGPAILTAFSRMHGQGAADALARVEARVGRLYVVPMVDVAPYRAPAHPRRSVPRWSFELEPVDEAITRPVTKFGGQPVWLDAPAWPLGIDGGQTTFLAQFAIPGHEGLVYLFLDPSAGPEDDQGMLVIQPGRPSERSIAMATGPTSFSDVSGADRYVPRVTVRRIEYLARLEPGFDLNDWSVLDAEPDVTRDDDRDWNKIGGNPRWLQNDEIGDDPGWQFLFQYDSSQAGRDLGEGSLVYGLLHDDGRSRVVIHSH